MIDTSNDNDGANDHDDNNKLMPVNIIIISIVLMITS